MAAEAITALGEIGVVVLGLDFRRYVAKETHEAPWIAVANAPGLGPTGAAEAAIAGLTSAMSVPELDDYDWVLVTW